MRLKLTSADGSQNFELKAGVTLVVGRAPTSDVPVFDPTISRRHAELVADDKGLNVKDLGSSNGTFLNGARVEGGRANAGDTVTFGKVAFKLQQIVSTPPPGMPAGMAGAPPGATIVRAMPVSNTPGAAFAAIKTGEQQSTTTEQDKIQQKLSILLEVSRELGRALDPDAILGKIVEQAYHIMPVDRVAIQLMDDTGNLVTKIAKDKRGGDQPRTVPQSIARKAVEDKVALSGDAGSDMGFEKGASIVLQAVRSFICSPLMASEGRVLGVLYVDNVSATHKFVDEDLDFIVAFAGLAAVAIENSQFADRVKKEMLARSNFERYFTPQLAQRIASAGEGATRLGGDKREVTVLFSDIRGFTALSEKMPASEMATLLTDYFTEMVECVFKNEGTLDKFIGDAVMAQWGAPIGSKEDPDKAMTAAIEMIQELDKLNVKWKAEGRPELQIGIGLNHGEAFAGNIGSERRLEYTVIGDVVNTASRLCSAAGKREILISEDMRKALSKLPALEVMPPMELKGKSQPVPVYRVVL
jgi:adenylate cyclase